MKDYFELLDYVNGKTEINSEITGEDLKNVKKVAVILSSSRAGSSLVKYVLSKHPDIITLTGEEEPFYILTGNGFGMSSDSDAFEDLNNIDDLRNHMANDIQTVGVPTYDYNRKFSIIKNRLLLQLPTRFNDELLHSLIWHGIPIEEIIDALLEEHAGYYDYSKIRTPFREKYKIEEPPFVAPRLGKQATKDCLENKVLLLKTPQDCYRLKIFPLLFPKAEIKYIHLTRGFAQTVNGLMDGWLDRTGFFAHNMNMHKEGFDIIGYSSLRSFGQSWWKFDLPPNWRDYAIGKHLHEVCTNQWYEANRAIIDADPIRIQIKFEDFLLRAQSIETIERITDHLQIGSIRQIGSIKEIEKLPNVMSTEKPARFRWRKRKHLITYISEIGKVREMMNELNYNMNPEEWI